ncbi:L-type lectin-domain containing receptor kinase IX.1-like [Rutidosis leptorrhynchoides]|uniref:L-type lectin-domain containing receptor kinase IX.1-like n=1 Tax=Rutidosis leptorrhynchoides TaxID=125765 RepID=UPI003A99C48C
MAISIIHMTTFFLLVSIRFAAPVSFNLQTINTRNQNLDILTLGDVANISDKGIQVTPDGTFIGGRAIYKSLLHLWDNTSGELASFSTNFTFVIDSNGSESYADGLTFFLAENNYMITEGGAMGLPINIATIQAAKRFVAVEFDTFWDSGWDPFVSDNISMGDHVGISISSLTSVRSQKWLSNVTGGRECQALIDYDSTSNNLSVSITGYQNNTVEHQDGLFYTVDLRKELPEWVIFGFSASTGGFSETHTVKSWTFNSSNLHVDDVNNGKPPAPGPKPPKGGNKMGLIIGLSVVTIVLMVVIACVFCWIKKKKKKWCKEDHADEISFDVEMNNQFEMGTGPKKFSYSELARSTSDFAENEKLGEGGFGGVYRGFLRDSSTYVAVKRVSKSSNQGIKEYASEVNIISRLRHRNLVQLIGWCHQKGELLLVYEYMENGSLDSHLFKEKSLLKWDTRYKIANGLASALFYLHEEWEQCVLHRDIKSSNVMLDSHFNTKLGDFGLAKMVDHEKGSHTTMLAGTIGYLAPECVVTGKASKESDVYSFGVVALEIACGRKACVLYNEPENQIRLVEWVWDLYGTGTLLQAVDPRLGSDFEEEEIKCLMIVGLWCVHPDPELRPSVRQLIQVLKFEASQPILPSKMPVASYSTPPISSYVNSILESQ